MQKSNLGINDVIATEYRSSFFSMRGLLVFAFLTSLFFVAFSASSSEALTTVPTKMNFQGRLADSAGNVKANGTYNMRLKLYTVSTAGTAVWSEDRLVSATQGVTVTNGTFSIQLGSITTLPASLFASGALYLEVELPTPATATSTTPTWTEGAMTPRNQMATSAYAYNAETLDGLDSDSFAQLAANNTYTGTNTFNVLGTNAFRIQNGSAVDVFKVDTSSQTVTVGGGPGTSTARVHIEGQASTSAMVWMARAEAQANTWNSVTYGNGQFVAVSEDGTNRVMTSPDGITWTARTASEANAWYSVTYGNGLFVAVSYSGTNRVMTSPDGITWTARTAAQANTWNAITYGNGLFVAVSSDGTNRVMTSPDGITWTARTASEANSWRTVTYGNGLFVAVSYDGTNRVMTSPDGITWTARSADQNNTWVSVAYGNEQFVVVAQAGTNRVMTSPDGITWTNRNAAQSNSWESVTYGNGLFVAVSYDGTNRVMTSPDGITWTARTAAQANLWYSVTYGNGQFVAVSISGTNRVMTASDIAFSARGAVQINGELSVNVLKVTSLDTAIATVLTFGANNATSITIAKDTTIAAGKTVTIVGGTTSTRPASPIEGMIYYNTTTKKLEVYSNGKWQADRTSNTKIVASGGFTGCTGSVPVASSNPDGADYVTNSCTSAQTAINAAITALPAGGGTVYMMEGTYIIDGEITLPSNVTLTGAGASTVLKLKNSINANVTVINASSGSNKVVSNIKLDGNIANNTAGAQRAVDYSGAGNSTTIGVVMDKLDVQNFRNEAIYAVSGANSKLTNSYIAANNVGIHSNGVSEIEISGNIFSTQTNKSIESYGSRARISNNKFSGGSGILVNAESIVANNTIQSSTSHAIVIDGDRVTVTGNTVSSSTGTGIAVGSAKSNNIISGNTVTDSGQNGISTGLFDSGIIISNNTVMNSGTVGTSSSGIYIDSNAGNSSITGNRITDTAGSGYAINIAGPSNNNNYISNNTFSGTGASSINDGGTDTIYANQLNSSGQLINRTTGGFAIQSTTGTNLMSTTGTTSVTIGTSDTTGTVLVLDTKNDAGDPTGINGGMYYNSNVAKFRCYQGNVWSDCISGQYINVTAGVDANPVDAATSYFATSPSTPNTTSGLSRIFFPKAGTIKMVKVYTNAAAVAGSGENWSMYIRKNGTTDTLIATVGAANAERTFNNDTINITVAAGDYIEIKSVQPTWVTNPTNIYTSGYVYFE